MIHGIGIELVEIKRMTKIIKRWQERFIQRVFTPGEIEYCRAKVMPEIFFAARFAAKEAFLNSVSVGFGVRLIDIEVRKQDQNRPILKLYGRAKELLQRQGIKSLHVSLSPTGDYTTAVVISGK